MGHVSDVSEGESEEEPGVSEEPSEEELRVRLDHLVEGFLQMYTEKVRAEVANTPVECLPAAITTWEGLSSSMQGYDIHGTIQEKLELVTSVMGPALHKAESLLDENGSH